MKAKIWLIICLFLLLTTTAYCEEQKSYIDLAHGLTTLAVECKNDKKPDKITVIYNSYLVVREKIIDKNQVIDCDRFFADLKNRNSDAFIDLAISMVSLPMPLWKARLNNSGSSSVTTAASINANSYDIDKFMKLLDKGVNTKDITIKGLGEFENINIEKMPKIEFPRSSASSP
jgi:hypothetical protein